MLNDIDYVKVIKEGYIYDNIIMISNLKVKVFLPDLTEDKQMKLLNVFLGIHSARAAMYRENGLQLPLF